MNYKVVKDLRADLWIDNPQAPEWRAVLAENAEDIASFAENGYVILKGAVPVDMIDLLVARTNEINRIGAKDVHFQYPDSSENVAVEPGSLIKGRRMVDTHASIPESFDVISSPKITSFLKSVFNENPLLIQSHYFKFGSEQPIHKDNAYVVVDKPLSLIAIWIALEDVHENAGPVMVVPTSHRRGHFLFNGDRKDWVREVDGLEMHEEWRQWMYRDFEEHSLAEKPAMLKKGDVLVWHGDLAHRGSEVKDETKTRHSLVGHYCPSTCRPSTPYESTVQKGDLVVTSMYYDVSTIAWLAG